MPRAGRISLVDGPEVAYMVDFHKENSNAGVDEMAQFAVLVRYIGMTLVTAAFAGGVAAVTSALSPP